MSAGHHDVSEDRGAAYTGLIVGAIILFAVLFGVVKATNGRYANEAGGTAAAESTK